MVDKNKFFDILKHNDAGYELENYPLYSKTELAKRWGVSRQVVNNWAARHTDFCKPIHGVVEGSTMYYPYFEVKRYEQTRGLNANGEG